MLQKIALRLRDGCTSVLERISAARREEPKRFVRTVSSVCCFAALSALSIGYISYFNSADISLAVYADGRYVGNVECKADATLLLSKVRGDISDKAVLPARDTCSLTYSFKRGAAEMADPDMLYTSLYEVESSYYTDCIGLYIDGELIGAADEVDKSLLADRAYISTKEVLMPKNKVLDPAGLSTLLDSISYEAVSDDLLFEFTQDEDKSFAPNLEHQNAGVKNDITLPATNGVDAAGKDVFISEEEYTIPYETVYEQTDELYVGQYELKQNGTDGKGKTLYIVKNVQGVEISREKTDDVIVSKPTDKIILVGTKEAPKGITTGTFDFPLKSFVYTDLYGSRTLNGGYSYHYGVDMYAPKGTPIYASDGGHVIVSGTHSSFGKYVIIEHQNGYRTLYAHMSALVASEGEYVNKGDMIGRVGCTGMAYGYHLHFEIRYNDEKLNPQKFLPY